MQMLGLWYPQVVDDDGLGYCDDGEEYLDRKSDDEEDGEVRCDSA